MKVVVSKEEGKVVLAVSAKKGLSSSSKTMFLLVSSNLSGNRGLVCELSKSDAVLSVEAEEKLDGFAVKGLGDQEAVGADIVEANATGVGDSIVETSGTFSLGVS